MTDNHHCDNDLPESLICSLQRGEIKTSQVVSSCIEAIKRKDSFNALCVPVFEQATELASQRDLTYEKTGASGPLHGLPVTIKECLDFQGTPSTFGLLHRKHDIPLLNDIYVQALVDAGAVIVGKTNVSQLLSYIEADNAVYGLTTHSTHAGYSCGGSSGGEGALSGAGLSPLGIGTDIGGSVRIPAAVNGACAIKPSRLRTKDCTRFISEQNLLPVTSVAGPISQDAFTLHTALSQMDQAAKKHWCTEPLRDYREVDISSLTIGFYDDDALFPASKPIKQAIKHARNKLEEKGATVVDYCFPDLNEAEHLFYSSLSLDNGKHLKMALYPDSVFKHLKGLMAATSLPRPVRKFVASLLSAVGQKQLSRTLGHVCNYTSNDLRELTQRHHNYLEKVKASLQSHASKPIDAVISPILPVPAYLQNSFQHMGLGGSYSLIHNVTGFPAGVARVGTVEPEMTTDITSSIDLAIKQANKCVKGSSGLPLSVQISANMWREDIVIALINALHLPTGLKWR